MVVLAVYMALFPVETKNNFSWQDSSRYSEILFVIILPYLLEWLLGLLDFMWLQNLFTAL